MEMKFSNNLLTLEDVITEGLRLAEDCEIAADDYCAMNSLISEIICDPCDTLNHLMPRKVMDDRSGNKFSDYCCVIASAVSNLLTGDYKDVAEAVTDTTHRLDYYAD